MEANSMNEQEQAMQEVTANYAIIAANNPQEAYKISCMASYNNMTPAQLMVQAYTNGVDPDTFAKDVQEFWETYVN